MAVRTSARAFEIFLAGFDISSLEVRWVHAFASTAASLTRSVLQFLLPVVDERHQAGDFRVGMLEARHAFVGATIANDSADLFSVNVGSHQLRTREVGPAFTAASVA